MVFNKTDLFNYELKDTDDLTPRTRENNSLDDWKNTWFSKNNKDCVFISAAQKDNWETFRSNLYERIKEIHAKRHPYNTFLY